MNNRFYIPQTPQLKTAIHSIWQVEQFTAFHKEHIIPKGIVEIIFNFSKGSPINAQLGAMQFHLPNCFINGFNRVPIQLKLPEQQVFFGILLQPMAVRKILNTPASQFSDLVVDLTLVDADFHSLWHQLAEQTDFDSRVALFSKWVETKSCPDQPREKLVNDFLMQGDRHNISVSALASSLCYSTRQLSRKILESTGMNTEEILLYKKYLHAMHLIHHTNMSLTQIAYESNFSDQSHLIKSFKSFTQMTPGEYKRNKSVVKGHLYEHVR